jgi:hypothetical protein
MVLCIPFPNTMAVSAVEFMLVLVDLMLNPIGKFW